LTPSPWTAWVAAAFSGEATDIDLSNLVHWQCKAFWSFHLLQPFFVMFTFWWCIEGYKI
jgi:hypothetical protein